ncbi:hypothetical protein ACFLZ8_04575, partial [Planctomycetota bacterium]
MIVPMSKIYIVTQSHNRDRFLDILASLGVVHIEPVEAEKAVAKEQIVHAISTLEHALQILQILTPSGQAPDLSALDAATEAISIQRASQNGTL